MVNETRNAATTRLDSRGIWLAPSQQPMVVLFASAIVGICLARWSGPTAFSLAASLAALGLLVWFGVSLRLSLLCGMCAATFWWLHAASSNYETTGSISTYVGGQWQPIVVRARIESPFETRRDTLAERREPALGRQYHSIADVRIVAIRLQREWVPCSGSCRLSVDGVVDTLLPGDLVRIDGRARRIAKATNPGEFDAQRYYAARRQTTRLAAGSAAHLRLIEPGKIAVPRFFGWLGQQSEAVLRERLGEESSAIAAAIVLGRREAVSDELQDKLLETGTIHLLAVSGLHLGILAAAVWILSTLAGMRSWTRTIAVIVVCGLYMGLTGGRPPVIRAFLLLVVWLLGARLGRPRDDLNALAAVGFWLLIYDPLLLVQPGPQLSFLAVAVLLWSGRYFIARATADCDPVKRLIASSRGRLFDFRQRCVAHIRSLLLMSGWVTLFTIPLVWHQFHVVSFVSVVANVFISPLVAVVLIGGMLTVAVGLVSIDLAYPLGLLTDCILQLIVYFVRSFAAVPGGHVWLPSPPATLVLVFYFGVLIGFWQRLAARFFVAGFAGWMAVAFIVSTDVDQPRGSELRATFIDVGHGTSVLLQSGESNWLYDAGRLGDPVHSARPIESVLWDHGIADLDGIFVSHADADHYNAIERLTRRFRVAEIVAPADFFASPDHHVQELAVHLQSQGIPVREVSSGSRVLIGSAVGYVMHPPRGWEAETDNACSLVLSIPFASGGLLLPGDLEGTGLAQLLHQRPHFRNGVLMAPHHGSLSHSPIPLLRWCEPRVVVISGGRRALRPDVLQTAGETGSEVFLTARDGAVRVTLKRDEEPRVESYVADYGWRPQTGAPPLISALVAAED